jgi:hypothetical protein
MTSFLAKFTHILTIILVWIYKILAFKVITN